MCFSATASFVASAGLTGGAFLTLRQMRSRSQLLFALYPLLFAVQQCAEGVVWVTLNDADVGLLNAAATAVFLAFSHVIWPTVIPLSLLMMERAPRHRLALKLLSACGALVSTYVFVSLFIFGDFASRISSCDHIIYAFRLPHTRIVEVLYFMTMIGSYFATSNRRLSFLGIFIALAFLVGRHWYFLSFISVSCFFATGISALVYAALRWPEPSRERGREPSVPVRRCEEPLMSTG